MIFGYSFCMNERVVIILHPAARNIEHRCIRWKNLLTLGFRNFMRIELKVCNLSEKVYGLYWFLLSLIKYTVQYLCSFSVLVRKRTICVKYLSEFLLFQFNRLKMKFNYVMKCNNVYMKCMYKLLPSKKLWKFSMNFSLVYHNRRNSVDRVKSVKLTCQTEYIKQISE